MPFAAYWALITSAATSLYSITAFISLTWRLCPHQISPLWLCPLLLHQVSTLHGDFSSSHLTSFSWLLPSMKDMLALCFPAFTSPSYCGVHQRTDGPVALIQWLQPVHLDLAWGNLIYTPAFYSKGQKTFHTHFPAVKNPQMPVQGYLIKFCNTFLVEAIPLVPGYLLSGSFHSSSYYLFSHCPIPLLSGHNP